jgi:hypothetical protein
MQEHGRAARRAVAVRRREAEFRRIDGAAVERGPGTVRRIHPPRPLELMPTTLWLVSNAKLFGALIVEPEVVQVDESNVRHWLSLGRSGRS